MVPAAWTDLERTAGPPVAGTLGSLDDQRDVIDAEEFGLHVTELGERTDRLLATRPTHDPNRRLLGHLANEREHLFTFLTEPGELAGRAGAAPRDREPQKLGGNRRWGGTRTQQITMTVNRTARQQGIDPIELMAGAQRCRARAVSELIKLPARASPTSLAA
jgi:hypothetical protein